MGEKRAEVVGVVCGLAGGGGGGSVGGLRRVGRGGMVGGGLHRKKMWNSGWVCDCRGIGVCGGGVARRIGCISGAGGGGGGGGGGMERRLGIWM